MEDLLFEQGSKFLNRKTLGVFWIILGIFQLIVRKDSLTGRDWGIFILLCLIGIIYLTPLAGSEKSQIEICEDGLKIIWLNWIRKVTVMDSEIESIVIAENGVMIRRKGRRPLKLKLYFMSEFQKNKVFDFFTEYARVKSLVQE